MFSVIRSGLDASLKQLDVLSNNIANAKTTGYKRSDASFQDIYAEKASFLAPGRIGHGASLDTIRQFRSQGPLKQTNQTLDLAIEGQGMFVLKRPDAPAGDTNSYTRDGSFSLDNDGFITSSDGQLLLSDTQQPIQVPRSAIIQGRTFFLNDINIDEFGFWLHLIPETLDITNLGEAVVGDEFNIEVDQQTYTIINTVENYMRQHS